VKVHLLNPDQLFKDGYSISLFKEGTTIIDPNQRTVVNVKECGNIYPFDLHTLESLTVHNYSALSDNKLTQ
jgi:hypothetical protein